MANQSTDPSPKHAVPKQGTPRPDKATRREADVAGVGVQLRDWSNQLDDLVKGYLAVGAHENDPYRLRIDGLRERYGAVQGKFDELAGAAVQPALWASFRSSIAEDWAALRAGFKDLTVTPAPAPVAAS